MAQQLDVRYVNFYTAGSSALKVAPAIPLETLELPRKKRAKRIVLRIDPVACIGIVLAAVMMVLLTVGFVQLSSARKEAAVMASYVDTLRKENEALKTEFESGYNLEEVEEVALALGMIPAEQARHITVPADNPLPEDGSNVWHNFCTSIVDLFA